jgi:hypothetical protein
LKNGDAIGVPVVFFTGTAVIFVSPTSCPQGDASQQTTLFGLRLDPSQRARIFQTPNG